MKRYLPFFALLVIVASAATLFHAARHSSSPADARRMALQTHLSNLTIAPGVLHKNLAVFPILSKTPQQEDRYVTLDEGLAAGTVQIYEVGADGRQISSDQASSNSFGNASINANVNQAVALSNENQQSPEVNRLMLVNRSGRPLYLMPGEVIVGGSQDRTIAQERVIASNDTPVELDVFCVEHGRWGGRGEAGEIVLENLTTNDAISRATTDATVTMPRFVAETAVAPRTLANLADSGKFVFSAGNLDKSGRLAVQEAKDQGAVWESVRESVEKSTAYAETLSLIVQTSSFSSNYSGREMAEHLQPYLGTLHDPVVQRDNVVGVVVAINGKVESFDLFESTPLFRKLWPKLLKSYALDALGTVESQKIAETSMASADDARRFLEKGLLAEVSHVETTTDGLAVFKCPSDGFVGFSAMNATTLDADELGTIYGSCRAISPIHASGFSSK